MDTDFGNFRIIGFDTNQASALFTLIDANRTRLETYFAGTVKHTKTLEETIDYCRQIAIWKEDKSYFMYPILDTKRNTLIGLIDVKNIDWNVPKAEIGYFIDHKQQGKGVISNALKILIRFLIKEYHFKKLLCRINSQNVASIRVALKNGFELEGTIRNDYRTTSNEVVDLNYYGQIF